MSNFHHFFNQWPKQNSLEGTRSCSLSQHLSAPPPPKFVSPPPPSLIFSTDYILRNLSTFRDVLPSLRSSSLMFLYQSENCFNFFYIFVSTLLFSCGTFEFKNSTYIDLFRFKQKIYLLIILNVIFIYLFLSFRFSFFKP